MWKRSFAAGIWGIVFPLFLYYVLQMICSVVLQGLFPKLLFPENAMWILTAENLLLFPVFFWMYDADRIWRQEDKLCRPRFGIKDFLLVVLGAVCVSRGINLLLGLTPLPYWFPGYKSASEAVYSCSLYSQIAASVISAPLLEEVLMRGLLYSRLKLTTKNRKLSMLVSALVFGLFHGNAVQGVYALVLGLFFVQVYETYRQALWPAVLAHLAANAASVLSEQFAWMDKIYQSMPLYCLATAAFLLAGMFCWKIMIFFCSHSR